MEAALSQIRELHANSNVSERQKIQKQVRDLERDLYTDWEIVLKLGTASFQWALIEIGVDLEIFTTLCAASSTVTHEAFVHSTKAAPTLLAHVLRSMATFGLITETCKDTFSANRTMRMFTNRDVMGAAIHLSQFQSPVAQVLPAYLKEHGYRDITGSKDLPFNKAMKTDLEPFEWMKQNSEQMKAMGHIMVLDSVNSWVTSYPVEEAVSALKPADESALLVDIGGGFGQHSVAFKNKFSDMPGRIVVQDIPSTLAHAQQIDGIEFQAHDFFTPQPIHGAKFYYLRHILHDWADEDCIRILSSIIPAMAPESRILIDEVMLPETKVPWLVAISDIMMMASLGGIERTKEDWESLLSRAGLKIMDVHCYNETRAYCVIAAVPK